MTASVGLLRPVPVPAPTLEDLWESYCVEVFAHAGLSVRELSAADLAGDDPMPPVVVVSQVPQLTERDVAEVSRMVTGGGTLLLIGAPGPLAEVAGCAAGEGVTEGHVTWDAPWAGPDLGALHAWGGVTLLPGTARVVARWQDGSAAATWCRSGAGVVVVIGADVWQSIVRIQQGFPVHADGAPAADGTAPIDDDILKCEDGLALSFEEDRALAPGVEAGAAPFVHDYPPTAAAPVFERAHADIWREVVLGAGTWLAEQVAMALPWLFYWPAGIEAVAHMSHDSDGNTDEMAEAAMTAFAAGDVRVTWCVLHPGGYSEAIYTKIAATGHEIALHYNAMGDTDLDIWGEAELVAQLQWLRDTTGVRDVVTNKNHYTRWEGWAEFYRWCEKLGIQVDQSRGPSKQGTIGFPFGSCHLAFPMGGVDDGGRIIDVLMMPLHTQDLWWTSVIENREVILAGAIARNGVAHFLFHGRNIRAHPEVADAVRSTAEFVRDHEIPWWTSAQLSAWERSRRDVRVVGSMESDKAVRIEVSTPVRIESAAIVLAGLDAGLTWQVADRGACVRMVTRNGRTSPELSCSFEAGTTVLRLAAS